MRPIRRGNSPIHGDYNDYSDARPMLIKRIGSGWLGRMHIASYCSYCERKFDGGLAVEHIQPKGFKHGLIKPYEYLEGRWENFLLACPNCNSTKKDKNVRLSQVLLPDRDNTFVAYEYLKDGTIRVATADVKAARAAEKTIALVGLNKPPEKFKDKNLQDLAYDRSSQRKQTWALAQIVKDGIDKEAVNITVRDLAITLAIDHGYFSIWMEVFKSDPDMRNRLIDAFSGTRESGCFDPITTQPISPAPNPDGLPDGGKL